MNILLVKCLVFFCYFLAFINTNEAKQADRLRQLIINSRRMPRQGLDNSWSDLMTSARAGLSKVSVINQGGSMETDRIDKLPGQPVGGVAFNQYGGYVTVDATKGRALFYYFVESPRGSSSKPLVLWLNGGPGCSSLGFGAMAELGPFRVNGDGKTLYANPFAWNQVVNVIFLESPVGVGFSYSNTSSDCDQSGDRRTAQDALTFLVNWLERFPQYKDRDFYITGESYAGHYVPQLAKAIIDYNKVMKRTIINLKGIAIGNAYLDGRGDIVDTNTMGQYEFFWTHALISDESWRRILSQCKYPGGKYTKGCNDALDKVDDELGDIDGYNIYAPICRGPSKSSSAGSVYQYDPCGDDQVDTYLNHVDVQKALHANTSMPYKWSACSDYPYKDRAPNMLPIIKQVIDSGVRVWLYSGDIDSVVSVTSTRLSINMLKLPIENPWRPWYTDNEVGGYIEGYQGLTFATVRGAGHEVPLYQPARALTLFTAFVQGKLPPSAEA